MISKIRQSKIGMGLMVIAGTFLMAIALKTPFDQNGIADGGFSGIAIVIRYLTEGIVEGGIPLWISNLALNLPLFLISIKIMGFKFLAKGLFGSLMLSFWLAVLPVFSFAENDLVIAALSGGALMGTGLGLVFIARASTGGTDMIAILLHRKFRHISVATMLRIIDCIVIMLEGLVFGVDRMLYSIVALIITTKVADIIFEGQHNARTAYIMTEHPEEVADQIMALNRGVTGIHAMGMYQKKDRMLLLSVVDKKQIVELQDLVYRIDPRAFVIVSDAKEVLGEGFNEEYNTASY